ncbi:ABC transporter permease [Streptomyces turgidiscabies]|uniref:ABC-2 type transport system permease protein n=1 Tax=Streptomyces turgidiscabies TaxID=85558 RepID=A0ABU0RUN9_9ACTN|nr:ABC transporter permease [Streptomyces turgidiscabies]MDQ0935704.1 ABC-2 type transport system permease protein [Streptomyces turgidiscabies]
MHRAWNCYVTATLYAFAEHCRNRLALALVLLFVPAWITLIHEFVNKAGFSFLVRATGHTIHVRGNEITSITGAINAVTLIVGFMMFITTFKTVRFDHRLAMAGFPRLQLILAKLTALLATTVVICLFVTGAICFYWQPQHPWILVLALLGAALTYGGLGVMLGAILRNEMAGMFLIIMTSLVDVCLQNPIANPASDHRGLAYLPSYGAMQAGVTAAYQDAFPSRYLLLGPLWFLSTAAVAAIAFNLHTRDRRQATGAGSAVLG